MTSPLRVFATRQLPGSALERLAERSEVEVWPGPGAPPRDALLAGARDADGLLCLLSDRIDSELLENCRNLRVVSSCSVGLDHIDLAAASARGIAVGFTPGVLVETTADLAFGLLMAAARRIAEADRFVRAGRWTRERGWDPGLLLGRDLHGATLGIIGLGAIGRAVARRARGFDMRVLGWTRSGRAVPGVETLELGALLERSDFVSIHVALAPETRCLIDAAAFARMRPGAVLVNAARGGIVDEEALVTALTSGRLAAAALDVFEGEPLDPGSPLLGAPIWCSPPTSAVPASRPGRAWRTSPWRTFSLAWRDARSRTVRTLRAEGKPSAAAARRVGRRRTREPGQLVQRSRNARGE